MSNLKTENFRISETPCHFLCHVILLKVSPFVQNSNPHHKGWNPLIQSSLKSLILLEKAAGKKFFFERSVFQAVDSRWPSFFFFCKSSRRRCSSWSRIWAWSFWTSSFNFKVSSSFEHIARLQVVPWFWVWQWQRNSSRNTTIYLSTRAVSKVANFFTINFLPF